MKVSERSTSALWAQLYDEAFATLRALRDGLPVTMRLATMDAKVEWERVRPQLLEVRRAVARLALAKRASGRGLVRALKELQAALALNRPDRAGGRKRVGRPAPRHVNGKRTTTRA